MVTISVDLWVCDIYVYMYNYVILETQCTIIIEHLIPSLLSIPTTPSNTIALQSTGQTHVYA